MVERPVYAKERLPKQIRHWTPRGTFILDVAEVPGGWGISICLDDRMIGFQYLLADAARIVAEGGYDDKIGFPASEVSVPIDWEAWVDPLDELDRLR